MEYTSVLFVHDNVKRKDFKRVSTMINFQDIKCLDLIVRSENRRFVHVECIISAH